MLLFGTIWHPPASSDLTRTIPHSLNHGESTGSISSAVYTGSGVGGFRTTTHPLFTRISLAGSYCRLDLSHQLASQGWAQGSSPCLRQISCRFTKLARVVSTSLWLRDLQPSALGAPCGLRGAHGDGPVIGDAQSHGAQSVRRSHSSLARRQRGQECLHESRRACRWAS
jgi:hypothetical protein